ncbi:MAG: outer membrane lipoprotein LolB [Proteobacteria bacterium]|nr:outer membrane lipoprotein LolB [Pseudomonadota bacterium]
MKNIFLVLMFSIALSACSTLSVKTPVSQTSTPAWQTQSQKLLALSQWNIHGGIGIQQDQKGLNAAVRWTQSRDQYDIYLYGPIGSGSVKIMGTQQHVRLDTADNRHREATSAEELLLSETGWQIPVTNLMYWIRGIPIPNVPATQQLDPTGQHLSSLQQSGWEIKYLRFTTVHGLELPRKIVLNHASIKVKIVITQWNI